MNRDIIVFDFETTGRNTEKCQVTQVAAVALDGRSLKKKGEFNSHIKTLFDGEEVAAGYDPVEDDAMRITRMPDQTEEEQKQMLMDAPELKVVWDKFSQFVNSYNWKKTSFFAPIPAGFNIINFDMPIVKRLCKQFGPYDKKWNSQALFHSIYKMDVMDMYYSLNEGDPSIRSYSMGAIRERLNMDSDRAHDALQDVIDTANVMIKLIETNRNVNRKLKWEKTFADGTPIS